MYYAKKESDMFAITKKLKISTKLYASFGLVLTLISGYALFSVMTLYKTGDNFFDYRTYSDESVLLGSILEHTLTGQMSVMRFRITKDEKYVDRFNKSMDSVNASREKVAKLIKDEKQKADLKVAKKHMVEYAKTFEKAIEHNKTRNEFVKTIDAIAPKTRKDITSIMESAFKRANTAATYHAGTAQQSFLLVRVYATRFLINNKPESKARALKELKTTVAKLENLADSLGSSTDIDLADNIIANIKKYKAAFLGAAGAIEARNVLLIDEMDKMGPQIVHDIENILNDIVKHQHTVGPRIAASIEDNILTTEIITGIVIFLGFSIAALFGRSMSNRMGETTRVTQTLADGNSNVEVTGTDFDDEIGAINKALLIFRDNIKKNAELEREQEEAKVRAEADRKQMMLDLADSFEERVQSIVSAVAAAATELTHTAQSMSATVNQSHSMAESASDAASETSANVQSVAAAVEEMSASIQEISTQTDRSRTTVNDSVHITEQGDKCAEELMIATEKVRNVISLISDIAGQINLLALNATIESARAGEAGKGFAVVANEVKNLAGQTDSSVHEIQQTLEEMGGASGNMIDVLTKVKDSINLVSEISGTISSAVEEQSATTNEISHNMQTAAEGTNTISGNLQEVSTSASHAQESASQVSEAADELSQQSEELDKEIRGFLAEIRSS